MTKSHLYMKNSKEKGRIKRSIRVRAKVTGTGQKPRLCVFRSSRYIYSQLIDDTIGKTLVAAGEKEIKKDPGVKITKQERAKLVGKLLAQKAVKAKIDRVVFDRNGYKYHGRVKSLAEGAKEGGLKF